MKVAHQKCDCSISFISGLYIVERRGNFKPLASMVLSRVWSYVVSSPAILYSFSIAPLPGKAARGWDNERVGQTYTDSDLDIGGVRRHWIQRLENWRCQRGYRVWPGENSAHCVRMPKIEVGRTCIGGANGKACRLPASSTFMTRAPLIGQLDRERETLCSKTPLPSFSQFLRRSSVR